MAFDARREAIRAAESAEKTVVITVPRGTNAQIWAVIEISREMESRGFKYVDRDGRHLRFTRDVGLVLAIEASEAAEVEYRRRRDDGEVFDGTAFIYRYHYGDVVRWNQPDNLLSTEEAELTQDGIGWLGMVPLRWSIFETARFAHHRSSDGSRWGSSLLRLETGDNVDGLGEIRVNLRRPLGGVAGAPLERWLDDAGVTVSSWSEPRRLK